MKKLSWLTVLLFVAVLSAACGEDAESCNGSCTTDEMCVNDECRETCLNTEECVAAHGGGWVCVPDGYCSGTVGPPASGTPGDGTTCLATEEVCDGKDNDCNGYIDEGVLNPCGVCGDVPLEVCDGTDNNCNGEIDETCECYPVGTLESCGTDIGTCELGKRACQGNFKWGDCAGDVEPVDEKCNGADDDCDGMIDEDFDLSVDLANCGACGSQCVFTNATTNCVAGICLYECLPYYLDVDAHEDSGCEYLCVPTLDGVEACDNIDNDCDGNVDEDFDLEGSLAHCGGCDLACAYDNATTICIAGNCMLHDCDEGYIDMNGQAADGCEYMCTSSGLESCDGLDNDCDGSVDEFVNCGCVHNDTMSCGFDVGDCKDGQQVCDNGTWGACDAVMPMAETCDNHDNDCDGEVDEGYDLGSNAFNCGFCGLTCTVSNGFGACADSVCEVALCGNGWFDLDEEYDNGCEYACWDTNGGVEQCDTLDNDCDGAVDEDFDLLTDLLHCGSCNNDCVLYQATADCVAGQCTVIQCDENSYDLNELPADGCEYSCTVSGEEICDGFDNDCDGDVDEGAEDCNCLAMALQPCGTNEGECNIGFQLCGNDGAWGDCLVEVIPQPEECDGLDNDCDGAADEDFDLATDALHCGECDNACTVAGGVGQCVEGVCELLSCNPGFYDMNVEYVDGCEYSCFPTLNGQEACDDIDNDCNGEIDEGFDLQSELGNCGVCGVVCSFAHAEASCELGVCVMGDCSNEYFDVNDNPADGCEYHCVETNGGVEVGDNLDNDCNGDVDEGTACPEGNLAQCGSDVGSCQLGLQTCEDTLWSACSDVGPAPEVCDGADNDCDNGVDEDFNLAVDLVNCGVCGNVCQPANAVSSCVNGSCQVDSCHAGHHDLDADPTNGCEYPCFASNGGVEACDGHDNNCDGEVDEGFDLTSDDANCGACGVVCSFPHAGASCMDSECVMGDCDENNYDLSDQMPGCEYACVVTMDGVEDCDEIDNDCNGVVDDGCGCVNEDTDVCGTNAGVCHWGLETCADGAWGDCQGGVAPAEDICDGADNDCDGAVDEDFDLNSDLVNCGACGSVCSVVNATASCVVGSCELVECLPGFNDLNDDLADGCEYSCFPTLNGQEACDTIDNDCNGDIDEGFDLQSELANCGACGIVCSFAHAAASCVAGVCAMGDCDAGYYDLNVNSGDGCEYDCEITSNQDLGDNLDNDCDGEVDEDSVCPEGNQETCGSDVGECSSGWRECVNGAWSDCSDNVGPQPDLCDTLDNDCDGEADEDFNLVTDVTNCGSCGTSCAVDNANVNCVDGSCELASCTTSYHDLNGEYADGCEYQCVVTVNGNEVCDEIDNDCNGEVDEGFDLLTDASNCGSCGTNCSTLSATSEVSCVAGVCQLDACLAGYYDIDADPDNGCEYACSPSNGGEEICDGVDNDCDNELDEGCPLSVVQCNICCPFGTGQAVVWWGNDPPFMWTSDNELCGTVTMSIDQICLRGEHPDYVGTGNGYADYNCHDGNAWTGWTAADVLSCHDQNGAPVVFSVITGTVDADGEAEIVMDTSCL